MEAGWRRLRADCAPGRRGEGLHALAEAAFATPRLRALSPGRSMCWLRFGRRVTPPVCTDVPRVRALGDGRQRCGRPTAGCARGGAEPPRPSHSSSPCCPTTPGPGNTAPRRLAGRARCDG
ncbi:DUF6193 family natural product biosynthesis protein [Streptomyces sp. NPDC004244]